MPIIRATAIIPAISGIDKDAARNVWHFATGALPPDQFIVKIGQAVEAFYDGVGQWFSPSVKRTMIGAKFPRVEMATVDFAAAGRGDDKVSTLFATRTMDIGGTVQTSGLPSEVAVALSFMGDVEGIKETAGATRPKSRRRGRVFIGPLGITSVEADPDTKEVRVKQTLRADFLTAYQALVTELGKAGSPNAQHVVYSATTGAVFPVKHVWVDANFDTIRSRGTHVAFRNETAVAQPSIA